MRARSGSRRECRRGSERRLARHRQRVHDQVLEELERQLVCARLEALRRQACSREPQLDVGAQLAHLLCDLSQVGRWQRELQLVHTGYVQKGPMNVNK